MNDGVARCSRVAAVFASLSLVSIGGGNTVLPEIHRAAVHDEQWMTDQQFADIYAISEAAPGPSSMISSLVGLQSRRPARRAGRRSSPSSARRSLLMYVACLTWERFRDRQMAHRLRARPGAGQPRAAVLERLDGRDDRRTTPWSPTSSRLVAMVLLVRTKISPLLLMAAAGVFGALGLVGSAGCRCVNEHTSGLHG